MLMILRSSATPPPRHNIPHLSTCTSPASSRPASCQPGTGSARARSGSAFWKSKQRDTVFHYKYFLSKTYLCSCLSSLIRRSLTTPGIWSARFWYSPEPPLVFFFKQWKQWILVAALAWVCRDVEQHELRVVACKGEWVPLFKNLMDGEKKKNSLPIALEFLRNMLPLNVPLPQPNAQRGVLLQCGCPLRESRG